MIRFKKTLCFVGMSLLMINQFSGIAMGETSSGRKDLIKEDYVHQKKQDEIENDVTELNTNIEQYLNSKGVFDEDIQLYSDDTKKELNMANTNCVWVQNEYYSVVDADEELLENTELQELTEEEINNYIGEQYYDIDTGFSQTFKEQTVNGVAKTSSNSRAKQYNVDMTDVSTLKVSLVVIEYASRVTVSVTYTWDTMPKYRQIDVAGIAWGRDGVLRDLDNADKDVSAEYTANYTIENRTNVRDTLISSYSAREVHKLSFNVNPLNMKIEKEKDEDGIWHYQYGRYCVMENAAAAFYQLPKDSTYTNMDHTEYTKYTRVSLALDFRLKRVYVNGKTIPFYLYYNHTYSKVKVDLDWRDMVRVSVSVLERNYVDAVVTAASKIKYSVVDNEFTGTVVHHWK